MDGRINFTIMENCFCKKNLVSEVIIAEIIVLTSQGWLWLTSMNIRTGLKHRGMVIFRLQSSQTIYVFGAVPGREEGKRRSRGWERETFLYKKIVWVFICKCACARMWLCTRERGHEAWVEGWHCARWLSHLFLGGGRACHKVHRVNRKLHVLPEIK